MNYRFFATGVLSLILVSCNDDGGSSDTSTDGGDGDGDASSQEGMTSGDGDGDGDTGDGDGDTGDGDGDGDTGDGDGDTGDGDGDTGDGDGDTGDGDGDGDTGDGDGDGDTGDGDGDGDGDTGGMCSNQGESCANGEPCCGNLDCCQGVPVPPGQEFCSNMCPISDRNQKFGFQSVDPQWVLDQVSELPITTWSYKSGKDDFARHIGPMAQDFQAAFDVGATDLSIFQVDADGVSLAAIQALDAKVDSLEAENARLRATLRELEERLAKLEK